jgi:hypothetical protein
MKALDQLGFPADAPVMIDAEKWSGESYEIFGDHSAQFNDLAARIRKRQGDRPDLAWAYGNRGPDLVVWPHKASWLGWVVASYGGVKPDVPNMIGWQYTNGTAQFDAPGRPHATPPFGRCDHNFLYQLPEDDMGLSADDKTWIQQNTVSPAELEAMLASYGLAALTGTDSGPFTGKAHPQFIKAARANLPKTAAALLAVLPPAAKGGLTQADVEAALDKVLTEGTGS